MLVSNFLSDMLNTAEIYYRKLPIPPKVWQQLSRPK